MLVLTINDRATRKIPTFKHPTVTHFPASPPSATPTVRLYRLPIHGDSIEMKTSVTHRITLNFGPERWFEAQRQGAWDLVPFRRHGLLFLPGALAPLLRAPGGGALRSDAEARSQKSKIVALEVERSVFEAAASACGWKDGAVEQLEPLTLTLDRAGLGVADALATLLVTASSQGVPAPAPLTDTLAHALAVWVLQHRGESPKIGRGDESSEAVRRAIACINVGFGQPLSVAKLAAVAGLSRHHFSRVFRQTTGLSPYQYIVKTRLQEALRLLEDTHLPGRAPRIVDVAMSVGFATHSQFSAKFRATFGKSPAQWLVDRPRDGEV